MWVCLKRGELTTIDVLDLHKDEEMIHITEEIGTKA